jgi:hypothetical protein
MIFLSPLSTFFINYEFTKLKTGNAWDVLIFQMRGQNYVKIPDFQAHTNEKSFLQKCIGRMREK